MPSLILGALVAPSSGRATTKAEAVARPERKERRCMGQAGICHQPSGFAQGIHTNAPRKQALKASLDQGALVSWLVSWPQGTALEDVSHRSIEMPSRSSSKRTGM